MLDFSTILKYLSYNNDVDKICAWEKPWNRPGNEKYAARMIFTHGRHLKDHIILRANVAIICNSSTCNDSWHYSLLYWCLGHEHLVIMTAWDFCQNVTSMVECMFSINNKEESNIGSFHSGTVKTDRNSLWLTLKISFFLKLENELLRTL